MPHRSLPPTKLFSRSIHLRARCTGRLRARFTPSADHSHSRKGISSWILRQERPAAKSSWTQPAGAAAMMDATEKCTKRFSKALNIPKSFFGQTMWKGILHHKEFLPFKSMDYLHCMA